MRISWSASKSVRASAQSVENWRDSANRENAASQGKSPSGMDMTFHLFTVSNRRGNFPNKTKCRAQSLDPPSRDRLSVQRLEPRAQLLFPFLLERNCGRNHDRILVVHFPVRSERRLPSLS